MLIASAAAELKRQQEQELEKEAAEAEAEAAATGGLGALSLSHSAGRLPSSAPPDVNTAAIAVMAGLEDRRNKAAAAAGGSENSSEEKTMDGMLEHEAYFPLSGGGGSDDGGALRGRASSLAEPRSSGAAGVLKPTSLNIKPRISPGGGQRWRGGVLGAPGGMMGASPGGGSIVGAGKLGVQCFTCTVGKKPSQAGTYVNDIDEVRVWGLYTFFKEASLWDSHLHITSPPCVGFSGDIRCRP